MNGLERRIEGLERRLGVDADVEPIGWPEYYAGTQRVGARAMLSACRFLGRDLPPAVAMTLFGDDAEQEAADEALLERWRRQRGLPEEDDARAELAAKLDRMAAARSRR